MMLANEIATQHDLSTMSGMGEIESRFGKISVNYDSKILIEKGLLGIADKTLFCELPFPVKRFAQFRLLQSLEEQTLSLILMPIALQNDIIETADLLDNIRDLGVNPENCSIFLVVNVYRDMDNVRISVNARAPIFVDKSTQKAEQSVLRNNKYMVRHMIKGDISQA